MRTSLLVLYGGTWRDAAATLPLKAWSRTSASGLRYVPCGYEAGMPTSPPVIALSCLHMTQFYSYVDLVFVPTGNIAVTPVCLQPLWSNSMSEMPQRKSANSNTSSRNSISKLWLQISNSLQFYVKVLSAAYLSLMLASDWIPHNTGERVPQNILRSLACPWWELIVTLLIISQFTHLGLQVDDWRLSPRLKLHKNFTSISANALWCRIILFVDSNYFYLIIWNEAVPSGGAV